MTFSETHAGDWFEIVGDRFLACDHSNDKAMKFDGKGKFVALVRLPANTEIVFLGRYISSAFEIQGHDRSPPRGAKGQYLPSGRKVPKHGSRDGKAK